MFEMNERKYLTTEEVLTQYPVCISALQKAVRTGKLARYKMGQQTFYPEDQLGVLLVPYEFQARGPYKPRNKEKLEKSETRKKSKKTS